MTESVTKQCDNCHRWGRTNSMCKYCSEPIKITENDVRVDLSKSGFYFTDLYVNRDNPPKEMGKWLDENQDEWNLR